MSAVLKTGPGQVRKTAAVFQLHVLEQNNYWPNEAIACSSAAMEILTEMTKNLENERNASKESISHVVLLLFAH